MLPLLLTLVMATSSIPAGQPYIVFVDDSVVQELPISPAIVRERLIPFYAAYWGVDETELQKIIKCESSDMNWAKGDYDATVGDYTSFGLAQLHNPQQKISKEYPKGISIVQALNPYFAVNYMAESLKKGTDHWSCQRILGYGSE